MKPPDQEDNATGDLASAMADVVNKAAIDQQLLEAAKVLVESERAVAAAVNEGHPLDPLLQFFEYAHLPPHLQAVSAPFGRLAAVIVATLPRNPERTVALRKLLESKDCAVRATIWKSP